MLQLSDAVWSWTQEKTLISKWPFLYEILPSLPVPTEPPFGRHHNKHTAVCPVTLHIAQPSPVFSLHKRHKSYTTCSQSEGKFYLPAVWGGHCWTFGCKEPLDATYSLRGNDQIGIYWPIYTSYLLSVTYCYSFIHRSWCLEWI